MRTIHEYLSDSALRNIEKKNIFDKHILLWLFSVPYCWDFFSGPVRCEKIRRRKKRCDIYVQGCNYCPWMVQSGWSMIMSLMLYFGKEAVRGVQLVPNGRKCITFTFIPSWCLSGWLQLADFQWFISTVRCSIPPPTRRSIPSQSHPLIGLGVLNHSMVI